MKVFQFLQIIAMVTSFTSAHSNDKYDTSTGKPGSDKNFNLQNQRVRRGTKAMVCAASSINLYFTITYTSLTYVCPSHRFQHNHLHPPPHCRNARCVWLRNSIRMLQYCFFRVFIISMWLSFSTFSLRQSPKTLTSAAATAWMVRTASILLSLALFPMVVPTKTVLTGASKTILG